MPSEPASDANETTSDTQNDSTSEAIYKLNTSASFNAADWPLVLAPTSIDPELIATDNDDTINQNMNLNAILKPKRLDIAFTPDIFDINLKDQL